MNRCGYTGPCNYKAGQVCNLGQYASCRDQISDEKFGLRGNQGQTIEIPDLTRIADALEKIARELERGNKLKALSLRHKYEIDNDHIDEIMED
jgi:hypothetical protein